MASPAAGKKSHWNGKCITNWLWGKVDFHRRALKQRQCIKVSFGSQHEFSCMTANMCVCMCVCVSCYLLRSSISPVALNSSIICEVESGRCLQKQIQMQIEKQLLCPVLPLLQCNLFLIILFTCHLLFIFVSLWAWRRTETVKVFFFFIVSVFSSI